MASRFMYSMLVLLSFGSVAASENLIDIYAKSQTDAPQAAVCDDAEFLRRASLDLTGVVPKVEDVKSFLNNPDRDKLVDRLLASPEFNEWWARFMMQLTTNRRAIKDDDHDGRYLYSWYKEQLQTRQPYNTIVKKLLTAKGNAQEAPPVNFILRYKVRPSDVTGAIGRAFLGRSMQCAQCHDHPFDSLSQDEFWGVAAFLARTRRYEVENGDTFGITDVKNGKMKKDEDSTDEEAIEKPKIAAKAAWPESNQTVKKGNRQELAGFVTSDPLFAKNFVNRAWARLMGQGILPKLDGFGAHAKPAHPKLLEELANHFVKSGYDIRAALKLIATSQVYQHSSRANENAAFAYVTLRPLTSDQLYNSIVRATRYQLDEDGSGDASTPDEEKKKDETPADKKMMKPGEMKAGEPKTGEKKELGAELKPAETAVADGADKADEGDEGPSEEDRETADNRPIELLGESPRTVRMALTILNNGEIHDAVDSGARYIMKTLGKPVKREHFDYAYMALLSRLPTAAERKLLDGKNKRSDLEDVMWALLNSVEFKNNH